MVKARPPLRLRPWKPGEDAAFTPAPAFALEQGAVAYDWRQGPPGHTWSIIRGDNQVIGVGGVVELKSGEWEAWAWLAETHRRDWPRLIDLAKAVLDFADPWIGHKGLVASARGDNPAAVRCLARLGFAPAYGFEHSRLPGVPFLHMERVG